MATKTTKKKEDSKIVVEKDTLYSLNGYEILTLKAGEYNKKDIPQILHKQLEVE